MKCTDTDDIDKILVLECSVSIKNSQYFVLQGKHVLTEL